MYSLDISTQYPNSIKLILQSLTHQRITGKLSATLTFHLIV